MPAVIGTGLPTCFPRVARLSATCSTTAKSMSSSTASTTRPVLLKNVNDDHNHWVGLMLIGGPKSPRDAVGSTVYLTAGGMRQRGDVMSGGSFESSNDFRLHFWPGRSTTVDKVEIRWPDGARRLIRCPALIVTTQSKKAKGWCPASMTPSPPIARPAKQVGTHSGK
jgi:hypothetical protein